ncbi:MAG TPA: 3'-5' exonuclease, partial [Gammaproteobacteria bacterium]
DPLTTAKTPAEPDIHYREGLVIAERIRNIVTTGYKIEKNDGRQDAVDYGDIFILFRNRTHIVAYEQALTDCAIPFASLEKGSLLEQQEVQDIEALLNVLLTPANNIALAQTLKSPIFGATDADLMLLAAAPNGGDWYERLQAHAEKDAAQDKSPALTKAWELLAKWRRLLSVLPVHDLLDRIFHGGELVARYRNATPPPLRNRVTANLQRLLTLALEIDSGRYPSLSNFLLQLKRIRAADRDQPDAPPLAGVERKVSLMTIHASKGLEAPVIFLAAADTAALRSDSYHALVNWPHNATKPEHLMLYTTKAQMPAAAAPVLALQQQRQLREQANLLYVALSRAKQMLFISGGAGGKEETLNWYRQIAHALQPHATPLADGGYRLTTGEIPPVDAAHRSAFVQEAVYEIPHPAVLFTTDKEQPANSAADPEQSLLNRQRGACIHKMLEMLSTPEPAQTLGLNAFLGYGVKPEHLAAWKREVLAILTKPELQFLFNPALYDKAYKEAPILYRTAEGATAYGIIDRAVVCKGEVWVIDYKTQTADSEQAVIELLQQFDAQLRYYVLGLQKIWPDKIIRPAVLLTQDQSLHIL